MGKTPVPDNPGRSYTLVERKKIWSKASAVTGHPPDIWRRDNSGNVINWQEYLNRQSKYGWEISGDEADPMPVHCGIK